MDVKQLIVDNSRVVTTVTLIGVSSALLLYYLNSGKKNKYPPGPRTLPLIGNLHQIAMAQGMDTFLEENRKIYGNVYTIELTGSKKVVVSGYENFHKLLVKNADYTSTRCPDSMGPVIKKVGRKTPGLFWAPYPHWKTLRSFAVSSLREDGMGKASLEPHILQEIEYYINHFINPNHGTAVEMSHSLPQATCNVISQLMYARRFDYDDEVFNRMIDAVAEDLELGMLITAASSIPLASIFMRSAVKRHEHLAMDVQLPILKSYVDECRKELEPENPKGLIDRFLIHSQQAADEAAQTCYSDASATILSVQLYVAGSETTATSLRWVLLYMCLYPELQRRVHDEIDEQIGQDRAVSSKDKLNMPFTEAVLLETLRVSNLAPSGLPHTLDQELEVDGKIIPANTELMFNFTSVLYDENIFEEPHTFKPDRYLQGDIMTKKQRTITFGLGRRACLGESLAKMEFFMFFVSFLQRYNVRLPEGSTANTDVDSSPLIRQPKKYEIIFDPR